MSACLTIMDFGTQNPPKINEQNVLEKWHQKNKSKIDLGRLWTENCPQIKPNLDPGAGVLHVSKSKKIFDLGPCIPPFKEWAYAQVLGSRLKTQGAGSSLGQNLPAAFSLRKASRRGSLLN